MCGICGQWSEQSVSPETLRQMADIIRHRGPDDAGYYIQGKIGLANRRLSIIDLESGHQPISNEQGTVWVVLNGEIYNYPELRRSLQERGHILRTNSDTEVIVHLYEDHGLDCVKKLRGMFAFALWDETNQQLLLARDPLGQKPLFYTTAGGGLSFASEIKALLPLMPHSPRLNARAMHHYISLRYVPGEDTLFEGVFKLPAGHYMTFKDNRLQVQSYWDLHYTPKHTGSEEEILAELRQLLKETVACHMLSDVPLGAFLSGGLDSTLVASVMASLSDQPVATFSIGVREPDFNELPFARMVAERWGTCHYEDILQPDVVTTLPEMIWHMEEPVDPFAMGVFAVARLASRHVKVVLGGDGGDEIFAGYDRYFGNLIVDLYSLIPRPLRRMVIEPLIHRLPDSYSYNNRVQKLKWLAAMSESSAGVRYGNSASYLRFSHAHKQALYTPQLWQQFANVDSIEHLLHYFNASNAEDVVDKMLYTDTRTRLAEHLLAVNDRMTMAFSIEGRSPLVDQKMVEFAATLPTHFKLRGRRLKYIQHRLAHEYLPEPLLRRKKQGFSFPLAYWFRNELYPVVKQLFENSRLAETGYMRKESMLSMLDEHRSGRMDHNYRLWLLLNLEIWQRQLIDQEPVDKLVEMLRQPFDALGRNELSVTPSLNSIAP